MTAGNSLSQERTIPQTARKYYLLARWIMARRLPVLPRRAAPAGGRRMRMVLQHFRYALRTLKKFPIYRCGRADARVGHRWKCGDVQFVECRVVETATIHLDELDLSCRITRSRRTAFNLPAKLCEGSSPLATEAPFPSGSHHRALCVPFLDTAQMFSGRFHQI